MADSRETNDRIFVSEQRTTDRALLVRRDGVAAALHSLYRLADEALNAKLAEEGYFAKHAATVTIRVEVHAERDPAGEPEPDDGRVD